MRQPHCVGAGPDDVSAGRVTTSGSRGVPRWWCLLLAATAAATLLLGGGVSQAQTTDPCATSAAKTYPNPAISFYCTFGARIKAIQATVFAYCPTTSSYTWAGGGLSTTCGSATTASTTPALVVQNAATSTLSGAAATTSSAVVTCPADTSTSTPSTVTGIQRFANQYGYTSGIRIVCAYSLALHEAPTLGLATIGEAPAGPQHAPTSSCGPPAVGFGFSVRVGEVIDAVSLECAVTGSHSASPFVPAPGPGVKGPALCPKGHALTGLQGTVNNNWYNSVDVIGLTGICTQYPSNSGLGAAGAGVLAYKGTSRKGAVKFSVAPKPGTAVGAEKSGWDYTLGGFGFGKSCSRASAKVPGKVAVFGRENAGQRPRFNLTSGRFSITGTLSGKLSRPTVSGRLKILEGACKGKRLRFTATASR
jgi:hypothetical protein